MGFESNDRSKWILQGKDFVWKIRRYRITWKRKLVIKRSDKRESFLIIRQVKRIETSCFHFFARVFPVLCKPSSINIGTRRSLGRAVDFPSVARNFSNDAWYRGALVFQQGLNLEETEDNE